MNHGRPHPDPVSEKMLVEDPELAAAYEKLGPRFAFAHAVIRARLDKGWTQKQLAREVGTSQSAIARLEGGDHDPRLSTMVAVCRALELPLFRDIDGTVREAR